MMSLPKLLPFSKIKEILSKVSDDEVVQYEGMISTQSNGEMAVVSLIELKVVFNNEPEKRNT